MGSEFFLESARLGFRLWSIEDLSLALGLWGDPEVAFYLGGVLNEERCGEKLRVEIDRQRQFGVQYWPVFERATGRFGGCAGLRPYHDRTDILELGVHIARRFWSARLGEEAARAVIDYAFDALKVKMLVAGHHPGNIHSKALIGRLGFAYSHDEPWGPLDQMHPFYRMERGGGTDVVLP